MADGRRILLRAAAVVTRRFERPALPPSEVRRILVCATGGLGNAVLLQPLVRVLRTGCPGARLDLLLTSMAAADLVRAMGWADRVDLMPEEEWYAGGAILRRFGCSLRARCYDWVLRTFLTAPEAARASLAAFLSGAPVRVAYGTSRANPFETHLLTRDSDMAETDRHLALAEALGLARPPDWQPASPPSYGRAWAATFIDTHGGGGPLIGFHPGSDPRYTAKRWPAERFGELAALAAARLGARPVVFGGQDDREAIDGVLKAAGGASMEATGQEIGATAGLMARCDAFVTNDSGLMHVAGLLGVPTLALFGPSDPVKNRPLDPRARILRLGLSCSPCSKEHAMTVCEHHECLRTLEVGVVFAALERLLADRAGAAGGHPSAAADGGIVAAGEEARWRR
jgi:heptosyltransferase-2